MAQRLAAIIAAAALCLPAYAAQAQNPKDEKPPEKNTEAQPPPKERTTGLDDVDYCKQQAQGLEGPARARFMTECLKRK